MPEAWDDVSEVSSVGDVGFGGVGAVECDSSVVVVTEYCSSDISW